jgi:hypothetical protein
MSVGERWVVVDRLGRCLRLDGDPARASVPGVSPHWVAPSEWHRSFTAETDASAVAAAIVADNRFVGAHVERRLL